MSRSHLATFLWASSGRWAACGVSILSVVGVLASGPVLAEPTKSSEGDRQITRAVVQLLNGEHMSKHALDNEISERCLERFLKMLDPWKLYFTQADVDALLAGQGRVGRSRAAGQRGFRVPGLQDVSRSASTSA